MNANRYTSIFKGKWFRRLAAFLVGVFLTALLYPHLPLSGRSGERPDDSNDTFSRNTGRQGRPGRNGKTEKELADDRRARHMKRETEKAVERGLVVIEDTPYFNLIDDEGTITRQALEETGVPVEKIGDIQKLVDDLDTKAKKGLKDRIYKDEARSDSENGVTVYRIPADRAAGDQMLYDFEQGLAKIAGRSAAEILTKALHPIGKLGWYGKLDIKITVTRNMASDGKSGTMVSWRCNDPASGQEVNGGQGTPEVFEKHFGRLFEIEGKEH
jgi:hypothetical protein